MHGQKEDYLPAIHAVIGRAVSELIEAGEPLGKQNILIMLQVHSAQSTQKGKKIIYQMAFRKLLEEAR
ncbi:hypothetical protein ACQK5W_11180 [Pantoea sp. FN060301]|uniref:hypothetical protein n=1 Tax=Pantoea sp. FN060301 TaxID=3420380 RepID=UPI003D176050